MKRILFVLTLFALITLTTKAQYATKVTVTNIDNKVLTQIVEKNISDLLTEFNNACFEKRKLKLNKKAFLPNAIDNIEELWKTSPFRCIETEIIESGVKAGNNYQVRNIPVFMLKAADDDNYEELVVSVNGSGFIESVRVSIDSHQYRQLLQGTNSVTDMRRRQVILDFIENFRTGYQRKDIEFLTQVYSDDALIITGNVVKQKPQKDSPLKNALPQDKIVLIKQTKTQYLTKLAQIFKNNSYITLDFDEIKITQHPTISEIYGVELRQGWHTEKYSDEGYLFLMIDFKNELEPLIQVRTWTPDSMFGLSDFDQIVRPD